MGTIPDLVERFTVPTMGGPVHAHCKPEIERMMKKRGDMSGGERRLSEGAVHCGV